MPSSYFDPFIRMTPLDRIEFPEPRPYGTMRAMQPVDVIHFPVQSKVNVFLRGETANVGGTSFFVSKAVNQLTVYTGTIKASELERVKNVSQSDGLSSMAAYILDEHTVLFKALENDAVDKLLQEEHTWYRSLLIPIVPAGHIEILKVVEG